MLKLDNVTLVMVDSLDDFKDKSNIRIGVMSRILPKILEDVEFGDIISVNPFNKNAELISPSIEQIVWNRNKPQIDGINWYCEFVVSKIPYMVTTDYYLIMQWDGFINNPNNWSDSFLYYDYIGGGHTLLNGGFSLRKTETMRKIIEKGNPQIIANSGVSSEDELYSGYFKFPKEFQKKEYDVPFNMEWPTEQTLSKFCSFIQMDSSFGWHRNGMLSIHSIMKQYESLNIFSKNELNTIRNYCLYKEMYNTPYQQYSIEYSDDFFNYQVYIKNIITLNKQEPIILHIDLGNQSVSNWIKENKYIIFSEILRYSRILLESNEETVQALLISNLADNIVIILRKSDLDITLELAMEYFISIEEYEKCAEVRDLMFLNK